MKWEKGEWVEFLIESHSLKGGGILIPPGRYSTTRIFSQPVSLKATATFSSSTQINTLPSPSPSPSHRRRRRRRRICTDRQSLFSAAAAAAVFAPTDSHSSPPPLCFLRPILSHIFFFISLFSLHSRLLKINSHKRENKHNRSNKTKEKRHPHHPKHRHEKRQLQHQASKTQDLVMGFSKTEVNLRRLLAAAPQQQNHAKLIHYVTTLRELLEQLAQETTPEGLPRVSKVMVSDYLEKIEAIASKLAAPLPEIQVSHEAFEGSAVKESPSKTEGKDQIPPSPGLRRRYVPASNAEDRTHDTIEADRSVPIKLDAAAQAHIEKHRKLQEDLTDEMVDLAQQLKERSLVMSQSLQNTEKILDSTEKAVEHSLASTGRANTRAMAIYSESFKTTCFTWLMIFVMTCIFMMVVLLIRVT